MLETFFRFVEHSILVCFAPAASEGLGTQLLASANRPDSPIMPKFRAPDPKEWSLKVVPPTDSGRLNQWVPKLLERP
jgi:hypothetical protein